MVPLFLLFLLASLNASAQNPTYTLQASCSSRDLNFVEFDIFLRWTNPGIAPNFEYAGGQFFFDINPDIGSNGIVTMSNAGSDLPTGMQPRNPTVYTATTPWQLRWAVNTFPGAGSGFNMPANNSVKIVRAKLQTTGLVFPAIPLFLTWRNSLPNPFTKVFAYVGTTNTEISTPATHTVDLIVCDTSGQYEIINLLNPPNNQFVSKGNTRFEWTKIKSADSYMLTISRSPSMDDPIYRDTVDSDTFRVVSLNTQDTILYWVVYGLNSSSVISGYSAQRFFTNSILLNLKCSPQAMLIPVPGSLPRDQTVKLLLRNATFPFDIKDSAIGKIDSLTLSGRFWFTRAASGTYYLVVKHFNSVETWSKVGGETTTSNFQSLNYDFTSSITQAYGNNMRLKGGKYCFYSGDVDQDGFIDATDLSRIDNEAYNFSVGEFLPEDLDGNGVVDAADFSVADNNRFFIGVISPLNPFAQFREQYDVDEVSKVFLKSE
jgi:hypothetical protein